MYIVKIKNDNQTFEIHGVTHKLKNGNVVKGINSIDSFSFSILPSNVGFKHIKDYKTLVTVYNTNKNRYEFQGRVLYSNTSMDESGLITKEVTCESNFGFLCDSRQEYVEERNWTVNDLLAHIISTHNSQVEDYKHFTIGEVTVTDPNDNLYVGIQRENSWKTLEEKLIQKLGGEIRFRVEEGVTYIDYLEEIGTTRATAIELSKNMKAITRECDPSNFISRLIPLGCKLTDEEGNETEERLDISSVNGGLNYIESAEAIEAFGIRVEYIEFDDVTHPSNLLAKGREYLAENNRVQVKYSVKSLDLSLLGLDIDDFDVHNYHPIKNALLGIDDTARINKKNIDVCNDVESTIEIGDNFKTFSDLQIEQNAQYQAAVQNVKVIQSTTNSLKSQVSNTKQTVEDLKKQVEEAGGSFLYIKYSEYDDGHVMTDEPDENTLYMGMCITSEAEAPTDHAQYTWVRLGEDVNDELEEIRQSIIEQTSYILNTSEQITMGILAGYTTVDDLEAYKQQIENTFKANEEGFSFEFSQLEAKLDALGGEIVKQEQYIRLIEGEIHIGKSDNPITTVYTNDALEFRYNGQIVAKFTNEVLEVRNITAENQVAFFDQWAIRKGSYVTGVGYNLNDIWIGG